MPKKLPIIFNSPSNLPFENLRLQNPVVSCDKKFIVTACDCGRQVHPQTCMKKNCLTCTEILNKRRADSAFNRFLDAQDHCRKTKRRFIFCYTDFTIPLELRQNFTDPKAWQTLRTAIWKLLKTNYGAVFAVEATHPIGDEHPNVFHPHLNFLWLLGDGFRPFIDVEILRRKYATILNHPGPVNCWHEYGHEHSQLYHWCKYVTRIFPEFSTWSGPVRWYGHYPKKPPKDSRQCPVCLKRRQVLGYIERDYIICYDLYGYRMGRSPPWEDDKNITPFKKHLNNKKDF